MTALTEMTDLKTTLDTNDIWNDIRVMLPSYGYTLELIDGTWYRLPINLQARATSGESQNKYGRRTRTMSKQVLYEEYAEAYCEGVLEKCKEPIQKAELKLIGVNNANILTALTVNLADQLDYVYATAGLNNTAEVDSFVLDIDLDGIPRLTLNVTDTAPLLNPPDPPIPERQFFNVNVDTVDSTTDLVG